VSDLEFKVGDAVEVADRDLHHWVAGEIDSIDEECSVMTVLSNEKQEFGGGRPTLYAILQSDWGVLVRHKEKK
jgi:hypothetical protein